MKKTEKLIELSKQLEALDENMKENRLLTESLTEAMEVEMANVIVKSMEDESDITEVQEEVKGIHKVTRKIGQRFFNLFKITFTVQFAGVTLIHWTIPKVDDDGQVISKNVVK